MQLIGSHDHPEPLRINVVLHEGNGPTVAEWNSARSRFLAPPGRDFLVELGELELCPGFYQWVMVGIGGDGTQHFLSKPVKFRIEGEHLGSTRVQPTGDWSVVS